VRDCAGPADPGSAAAAGGGVASLWAVDWSRLCSPALSRSAAVAVAEGVAEAEGRGTLGEGADDVTDDVADDVAPMLAGRPSVWVTPIGLGATPGAASLRGRGGYRWMVGL